MARILALDTSTEACSCALYLDGEIREDFAVIPRQHAQRMLPMIHALLDTNGIAVDTLDAVAWGRGPGSFTGLRIAAGIVQGIAFAADLPVVSVSTLAALALQQHQLQGSSAVLACIDARIDELYWACFRIADGLPQLVGEEQLCAPEQLPAEFLNLVFGQEAIAAAGSGLDYLPRFPAALRARMGNCQPELLPRAAAIARLAAADFAAGLAVAAQDAQPLYLRDKVTQG
jgi:tRNA threonylcarbamoyladenosine biosynthesis protein TsaB